MGSCSWTAGATQLGVSKQMTSVNWSGQMRCEITCLNINETQPSACPHFFYGLSRNDKIPTSDWNQTFYNHLLFTITSLFIPYFCHVFFCSSCHHLVQCSLSRSAWGWRNIRGLHWTSQATMGAPSGGPPVGHLQLHPWGWTDSHLSGRRGTSAHMQAAWQSSALLLPSRFLMTCVPLSRRHGSGTGSAAACPTPACRTSWTSTQVKFISSDRADAKRELHNCHRSSLQAWTLSKRK